MKTSKVAAEFGVTGQIEPTDVSEAAREGYRSIICNRPDGEDLGQPTFAEIEQAAEAAGMRAAYLPIVPGQMKAHQVESFDHLMDRLPKPVLAYCRSGARASGLWAASRFSRR
jgi:sulfide:quinone oxidoreductase